MTLPLPSFIAFCSDVCLPSVRPATQSFAVGCSPVSAGFPSPAEDYSDKRLDVNDYLVRNPLSTFFFCVQGTSMEGAQIFDGDMLVVDRSVTPRHGHIVVAFVDGERFVKRLYKRNGRVALLAENDAYAPLELVADMELVIWGVVIGRFARVPA